VLANLRLHLGKKLGVIPEHGPRDPKEPASWNFLWVVNPPLFEYDEEQKKYVAAHHAFTRPRDEDVQYLESDPGRVLCHRYDLVLNGFEIGGGSIRLHDPVVQQKVFAAMGISAEEAEEKFGFLLQALRFGAPPHGGIAIFARSAKHGTLRQLTGSNGCITGDGTTTQRTTTKVCRAVPNISEPWDVATPDNHFVYIPASYGPRLVQAFKRNARGGLIPIMGKGGCVSDSGTSPAGPCAKGHGLSNPERALPSKDGRFLYIGSYGTPSPIVVLRRNPKTGTLSERSGPVACISVDGTTGDKTGSCRTGTELEGTYAGALSPDGRTLYFSENGFMPPPGGLTVFRVSPKSGGFSQLQGKFGCVTPDGSSEKGPGTCEKGRAVDGAFQVALGSGGRDVYLAAYSANGVALFYAHR